MSTPQPAGPAQPFATPPSVRPPNGLGVAALALGVVSFVAAVSFILFPLGLLAGLVPAVLGGVAVTRGRTKGATNPDRPSQESCAAFCHWLPGRTGADHCDRCGTAAFCPAAGEPAVQVWSR